MPMSTAEAEAAIRSGIAALQRGQASEAQRLFEQVIDRGSPLPPPWFPLAQAALHAGDFATEENALGRVLEQQPRNIAALIMKGDCRWRADDKRGAISFYRSAINAASVAPSIPPMLAEELKRAEQLCGSAGGEFEDHLRAKLERDGISGRAGGRRFRDALEIMLGRKQVYLQEPNSFYFPGLPQIQYYERSDFPWIGEIEAAIPAMRQELERVVEDESAFRPYVEADPNRPQPANHLLGDPSWAAFYLWKSGEPVAENAERCPRTLEALRLAPMPVIKGRSPIALFSRLRPGAHIKPHNGMLNTRLICHIPLIAPPDCRLRVGNEVREWEEGKALIFDDSIEHEAWNGSDRTRTVLLFEIWRPEIDEEERRALTAMFEAITEYGGGPGADGAEA
jgi:aspartyl/asparaginyl beta-hydroxylase (cupin superfamily)